MRLQFLTHVIDAVSGLVHPRRIFGSSSLLARHPSLGELGQALELTLDADVLIEPIEALAAETLKAALGRDTPFMQQFGYYADILLAMLIEAAGLRTALSLCPPETVRAAVETGEQPPSNTTQNENPNKSIEPKCTHETESPFSRYPQGD